MHSLFRLTVIRHNFLRTSFRTFAMESTSSVSASGYNLDRMSENEVKEEASQLPDLSQNVLLHHGTERAFTGETVNRYPHDNHDKGTYGS